MELSGEIQVLLNFLESIKKKLIIIVAIFLVAAVVAYPLTDYVINDAINRSLPHVSTTTTDLTEHFDQFLIIYSGPWKVSDVNIDSLLTDSDKNILIYTDPVNISDSKTVVQDIILSNTETPSALDTVMEYINGLNSSNRTSFNDLMTALLESARTNKLTLEDLSNTSEIIIFQTIPYDTATSNGSEIEELGKIGADFENVTGQPPMFTIGYLENNSKNESGGPMVVYTKPLEVPLLKLKMSLVIAAIFTLPIIFYIGGKEIYKRVNIKKLNLKEKIPFKTRWILIVAIVVFISFVLGAMYSYFFMAPLFIQFLYISAASAGAQATYSIYDFVSFIAMLTLIFGLIFEFPVIIFVLNRLGIVQKRLLTKYRKHVYVLLFIIAAVITPPDVISQIVVAIPMIFFYELSILIVKLFGKRDPPLPAKEEY
ncbi:twin-arginine translocase subunit TatC [Methanolapillus millepedarum]|uniref:Sec-independent protein translocase protein TatC n=1 Tax=Methanolapillus millepedarum TaxID=3028296 RepID=A0AA96V2M8_9EURY|nr:Sec-independent protein translocase protein TatC [Methanosarcinaceae archaeon Ac7]